MTEQYDRTETASLLQDLGLKEYEARCFLALTGVPTATAKEISDLSEVPRTRVYDAIRVLEAEGLVEVQHSNPQQFRAVSVEEAASTLRQKYDDRIDTLQTHLESLDLEHARDETDRVQEVWAMSGHEGIESRSQELLAGADSEILLLVVREEILTERLLDRLQDAQDRGVTVIVGGLTGPITDRIAAELPAAKVFETELEWLVGEDPETDVSIGRLLLVDRTTLLVSSFYPADDRRGTELEEQAVFANGLGNGVVVLIRRLIATGLLPTEDPGR